MVRLRKDESDHSVVDFTMSGGSECLQALPNEAKRPGAMMEDSAKGGVPEQGRLFSIKVNAIAEQRSQAKLLGRNVRDPKKSVDHTGVASNELSGVRIHKSRAAQQEGAAPVSDSVQSWSPGRRAFVAGFEKAHEKHIDNDIGVEQYETDSSRLGLP